MEDNPMFHDHKRQQSRIWRAYRHRGKKRGRKIRAMFQRCGKKYSAVGSGRRGASGNIDE